MCALLQDINKFCYFHNSLVLLAHPEFTDPTTNTAKETIHQSLAMFFYKPIEYNLSSESIPCKPLMLPISQMLISAECATPHGPKTEWARNPAPVGITVVFAKFAIGGLGSRTSHALAAGNIRLVRWHGEWVIPQRQIMLE